MVSNETINYNENYLNLFARILMVISLACICILGVIGKLFNPKKFFYIIYFKIGNLIVLIVAFRKQNYRFVTNCYIINLATTDLLFLLISVPLTTYLGLTNTWILNGFVSCRVHIYLAHVSHVYFY